MEAHHYQASQHQQQQQQQQQDHHENYYNNNSSSGSSVGGVGSSKSSSAAGGLLCRQSSSRWIPTADQIQILRDLYYINGVRSPTAEQIQRISARLRQYGKIEGKNVFYWFQNHKARERQKKRLITHVDISSTSTATSTINITNNTCSNANKLITSTIMPPHGAATAGPGFYDHVAGHMGSSTGNSVFMERSFRECCLSTGGGGGGGGGNGTSLESSMGWVGVEPSTMPWMYHHHHYTTTTTTTTTTGDEEPIITAPSAAPKIQTLPLFPTYSQQEQQEQEEQEQAEDQLQLADQQQQQDHMFINTTAAFQYSSTQPNGYLSAAFHLDAGAQNHDYHQGLNYQYHGTSTPSTAAASLELTLNSYHCSTPARSM